MAIFKREYVEIENLDLSPGGVWANKVFSVQGREMFFIGNMPDGRHLYLYFYDAGILLVEEHYGEMSNSLVRSSQKRKQI